MWLAFCLKHVALQNNPNLIRFKWRLKRKHLPAKCVMRATESRRMEICLNKLSFWNTAINTKCKYKYRIEILNAAYFIMSSVVINGHSLSLSMPFLSNIKCSLRDDTHMTSMKIVQFQESHRHCSSTSKILPPPWPWTSSFKGTPPPSSIVDKSTKSTKSKQATFLLLDVSYRHKKHKKHKTSNKQFSSS